MTDVVVQFPRRDLAEHLLAEQGLLGCAMYNTAETVESAPDIRPEHFEMSAHAAAWEECLSLARRGDIADPVSIGSRLADHEGLTELGGIRYLSELVDKAYMPSAKSCAKVVLNTARLRQVAVLADTLLDEARPGADAFDLMAKADRELTRMLSDAAPAADNVVDARTSAFATLDELDAEAEQGRPRGAMTGLRCIDRRMNGLRPGWLVIMAGRPSMGKTALARAAALGCARRNPKSLVVFFALEMARRELDERTLAQLSHEAGDGIAYSDMGGGKLSADDRQRLRKLADRVPRNFMVDDSPILTVDYVRRRVLALKRRGPIAAVFIDYLQIMDRPDGKGRNEASVIGEMTKGLKQLARETGVCVVLLSQINRGVESRDDKRPNLSDLRESGAIEQDANAVLFPYREVYYTERAAPKADASADKVRTWETQVEVQRRCMDVIAAKVRGGAIGTDPQVYFAEYDDVRDVTEDRR